MNKELLREVINKQIDNIELSEKSIKIIFGEEVIEIKDYHEQDCCENVYADFKAMNYNLKNIIDKKQDVKEIVFKGVDEMGFLICFYYDWEVSEKVFIPCYNSQNGYYNNALELIVIRNGVEKKIDISDLVEDYID